MKALIKIHFEPAPRIFIKVFCLHKKKLNT